MYSTLPVKYLMSISMPLTALYQFEGASVSKDESNECFQFLDLTIDRIHDTKFKQKVELKLRGIKVKFKFLPRGESLGAAMVILRIDRLRVGYIVDYAVHEEVHIQGIEHKLISRYNFDFVLTTLTKKDENKSELMGALDRIMKNCPKVVFLVSEIPRLFEILLAVNELISKSEFPSGQISIPQIYQYYIDWVKSLSEYMPVDISQNLTIKDEDFFRLKYMVYEDQNGRVQEEKNSSVYLATVADFVVGRVFKHPRDFRDYDLVFCDPEAQHAYNRLVEQGVSPASKNDDQEMQLENADGPEKAAPSVSNKLVGSMKASIFGSMGEAGDDNLRFRADLETQAGTSVLTPAGNTRLSAIAKKDQFDSESKEVFFTFKNHDIFFLLPKSEKTRGDYGAPLSEAEFSIMEFMDPARKDRGDGDFDNQNQDRHITKDKDFWLPFFEFAGRKLTWTPELRSTQVLEYSWVPATRDQIIFLSKLEAESIVFLNMPDQFLVDCFDNYCRSLGLSRTVDAALNKELWPVKQLTLSVDFHPSELDSLKFWSVNSDLKFTRIKFSLERSINTKFELKVTPGDRLPLYRIIKSCKLLKIQEFMARHGLHFALEMRRLNLDNKVFIVTTNDEFTVQGLFSEEYFRVRTLLYEFINS